MIELVEVGRPDVDRLKPLWLSLHAHHQLVAPELGPYVDDASSWTVRRAVYEELLGSGGLALVARRERRDVGYATVASGVNPRPALFAIAGPVAELESLAVVPGMRGAGVGSVLLDGVERWLAAHRIEHSTVGVVASNERAIRLYRRRGFSPTWLTLTRFGQIRRAPPPSEVVQVAEHEIDSLQPLWLTTRGRWPAAPRSAAESWHAARGTLERASRRGVVLRFGPMRAPVGAAWVVVADGDPLWDDTWQRHGALGEIAAVLVDPEAGRAGVADALLDGIDWHLERGGVADQVIGAFPGDTATVAGYVRRGFKPTWLQLARFAHRGMSQGRESVP